MPQRPVTPSDCALAVALPLSRRELLAQLESERPSDFAQGIRRRFPVTPPDRLCDHYADELESSARVIAEARSGGVTITLDAGLGDLARLTERFHVVSVLAHAPTPGIAASDIADPGAIVAHARAGASPDQKRLRRHLRCRGVDLDPRAAPPSAAAVATVLDALLWTGAGAGPRRRGQMYRTRVEDAFPGLVRPAPVIELGDGPHSLTAVRGAIARSFDGVLDLSTCTSIVLGEALKRSRDDFLVLVTERPTHPKVQLLLYHLRMRELALARGPVLFTQVVRVVADALLLAARRR